MRIVILEDNADRRQVMSAVLQELFPGVSVEYFVVAQKMIEHLESTGIHDIDLICLDNDLDMVASDDGRFVDAGDGIEVAKWLVTKPPIVPTLVHTTNTIAGDEIVELLNTNGWIHARVVPYEGESWIPEVWRTTVRTLIVTHAPEATISSVGVTILSHGLKSGQALEVMLQDILRVGAAHSRGNVNACDFSFELACVDDEDDLISIVSVGSTLVSDFGGGVSSEVVRESTHCFGIGPLVATSESIEPSLRWLLHERGFREIQFDVVRPKHGHQALLLTGNRSSQLDLNSLKLQANIRAVKSLLELAFSATTRGVRDDIDSDHQLEIRSE